MLNAIGMSGDSSQLGETQDQRITPTTCSTVLGSNHKEPLTIRSLLAVRINGQFQSICSHHGHIISDYDIRTLQVGMFNLFNTLHVPQRPYRARVVMVTGSLLMVLNSLYSNCWVPNSGTCNSQLHVHVYNWQVHVQSNLL